MLHYPEALQVIDGLNTVSIGNSVRMYRSLLEGGELHILHPTYQHPRQVLYHLQEWPEPFWGRILLAIAFELKLDQKLNQQRLSTETDHALESQLVRFGFKAHRYRKEDDLENEWAISNESFLEGRRGRSETNFYTRHRGLADLVKANANHTCQCCKLVGNKRYTQFGERCIEAHHLKAFKDRNAVEKLESVSTKPEDMAALCANCHRVIHGQSPALTINDLRKLLSD